jgi:lysophospholipase L1-like esterase
MKKIASMALLGLFALAFTPKTNSWVAIGDSITYLNDHTDETNNRVTEGYMTRVCRKITGLKYINQGHNGWTSGGIADSIEQLGIPSADIYSIFLGTNDWWSGHPAGKISDYQNNTGAKTVSGSFRIIIDKIRRLNKDAKIILITPMQRGDFIYLNDMKNNAYGSYKKKDGQSLEEIVAAIKMIGEYEHLAVVDLYHQESLSVENAVKYKRLKDPISGIYKNYSYPAYTQIPFNPDTDEYPYPIAAIDKTFDGLHPSDGGNKIIADLLIKLMK